MRDLIAIIGSYGLGGRLTCGFDLSTGSSSLGISVGHLATSDVGTGLGLVHQRRRDHAAPGPHTPACGREPIALSGHHDKIGTIQRKIDGFRPAPHSTAATAPAK